MMANEADAEDVVGDVLVAVLRKLGGFRGESELSTWLHRLAARLPPCPLRLGCGSACAARPRR
jgi:hypothetical protein